MSAGPTIADRVRQLMPTLPKAERRVARTLLANYPVAGLETIARVAAKSGTSGPTVLRLTNRLGFGRYPELQQALRDELGARRRSPPATAPPIGDDVPALAADLLGKAVSSSLSGVERSGFAQAVELLLTPKSRVVLTGGRFSGPLADYLAGRLQQLRPGVRAVGMAERVPALLDLTRRDVVVVFDFRRHQPDVITFGRLAAEQGARMILFTDPWLSPLSAHAEVVLTAEVATPGPFDSLVPAMALVEALLSGIVAEQDGGSRHRIARHDKFWADQFE